jgi:hypothetical protein
MHIDSLFQREPVNVTFSRPITDPEGHIGVTTPVYEAISNHSDANWL